MAVIIANVLVMAMPHYGSSSEFDQAMVILNWIFTMVFVAEAVVKNLAMGPKLYIKVPGQTSVCLCVGVHACECVCVHVCVESCVCARAPAHVLLLWPQLCTCACVVREHHPSRMSVSAAALQDHQTNTSTLVPNPAALHP